MITWALSSACTWISPAEHAANMSGAPSEVSEPPEPLEDPPSGDDDGGAPPGDDDDDDVVEETCEDDPREPNDTEPTAWPIEAIDEIDGLLCGASTADWFSRSASAPGLLDAAISSDRCGDLLLRVDVGGSVNITSSGDCPRYTQRIAAGTYAIAVSSPGLGDETLSYDLFASWVPCDADLNSDPSAVQARMSLCGTGAADSLRTFCSYFVSY